MYPTSIDGKPSAGGFRMLPQTVMVFRTGFSRSERGVRGGPEALSGNKCYPDRASPAVNLKPSSIATLPSSQKVLARPRWQQAMTPRDYAACDAVDLEPRELLRPF